MKDGKIFNLKEGEKSPEQQMDESNAYEQTVYRSVISESPFSGTMRRWPD